MRILYLDCYSGISGDMFLGALVDAGLSLKRLQGGLSKLGIRGYRLTARKVRRGGISATKVSVEVKKGRDERRTLREILSLINRSGLERDIKDNASNVFRRLAEAEASVHKEKIKDLHFHEVGDTDSIVDVVGACVAMKTLGIDKVYASRINVGSGTVINTRSGPLPIPAPAALYMLKGVPLLSSDTKAELVTPTGAALLKTFAERFGYFPEMTLASVGYGAGANDIDGRPNCLRAMIGDSAGPAHEADRVFVIEANIDDMNPVDYEHLIEKLFREGALDAYLTSVQMKKTRPGILLTVLAQPQRLDRLAQIIFSESSTIGVRYYEAERKKLKREIARVDTKYGRARVKISHLAGGEKKIMPEYDDCKRIADARGIPLSRVRREIENAASRL